MMCAHMNDDHADAVVRYATFFGNHADVRSARLLDLDSEGMGLEVETDHGTVATRIAFDHRLQDADDARQTLIAMARQAGSSTSH